MSLHPQSNDTIPAETVRVAKSAFPKGNPYLTIRDELGALFRDDQFAALFGRLGRPVESPGMLALASVVQFAENLSDRQMAEAVRSRIDLKYLFGLELDDAGFDYSLLSDFRGWWVREAGEALPSLLDRLLAVFVERGLVKARGKQRTDSTHLLGAVRDLNRLELVGESMRQALNALARLAPDWLQGWVPSDWYRRYGPRFEQYRLPKTAAGRQELAIAIGQDGYVLLEAAYAAAAPAAVRQHPAIDVLRQVWVQNYYSQEGQCVWREAEGRPPGALLIQSPYDPQVRYSTKRELEWKGYKVHLTETCEAEPPHFITHVLTTPASQPDDAVTAQVHADLADQGLLPSEHYLDAGYTDAQLLADSPFQYGVDLIGPVQTDTSWQARAGQGFEVARFFIDWTAQQVTCPAGKGSIAWSHSQDAYGNPVIHVHFAADDCRACPLRSRCTHSATGPRTLHLRPQALHEALQQARQRQQTPAFQSQYARRAGIEGTLSQAVRKCDLRHARYLGQAKVHLQNILSAVAINLARYVDWVNEVPLACTRTAPFAALAPG